MRGVEYCAEREMELGRPWAHAAPALKAAGAIRAEQEEEEEQQEQVEEQEEEREEEARPPSPQAAHRR